MISVKEFFWLEYELKSYGPFQYYADWSLVKSAIRNFLTLSWKSTLQLSKMVWHLKIGSKLRVLWAKTFCLGPKMQKFQGAIWGTKLEIFLNKRYFWVTQHRHYLFLKSKSKSKKLMSHLLFFVPQWTWFARKEGRWFEVD